MRRAMRLAAPLLLLTLAFCANEAFDPPSIVEKRGPKCREVAGYTVDVTTSPITVAVGNSAPAAATTVAPCGGVVPNPAMTWTSRNTAVFTVAATTERATNVTGIGTGSAYLVAAEGGGSDSVLVTVTSGTSCTSSATNICPGDDVAAKVTAQSSGTTFTFGAGVFPNPTVTAKANMTFIGAPFAGGEPTTIFDGSKVLAGPWTLSGGNYFIANQTQQVTPTTSFVCQTGHPGCFYPEQLWVNNHLYEHMTTLGAIGAGKWYFDYTANRIYLSFDPTDSTVVTSVTDVAFKGTVDGVTIKRITVRRYAGAKPNSVVNMSTRDSWTMDSIVSRDNNGHCVAIGDNSVLIRSKIVSCGQLGYKAQGDNGLIYGSIIDSSNTAMHGPGAAGEAGAGKATNTDGFIFRRDTVRYNDGPGPWTDINNIRCTVDSNYVVGNKWRGIFHEIGYECDISYNYTAENGFDNPAASVGACDGAGILISSSRDTEVHHNEVVGNRTGICAQETDRGTGTFGKHDLVNLNVHHNLISQLGGANRAGGSTDSDATADPYSAASNNKYANNTYTCTSSTRWRWFVSVEETKAQWLALGQDTGSTFSGC